MSKVLLVEDNLEVANIALASLRSIEVVWVVNLEKADAALAAGGYDLILLDIGLPDGDGVRFYTKLQSHDHTRDIPVIFLTGKSDLGDKVIAFSLGADDYITKPFDPLELQARVKARLKKIKSKQNQDKLLQIGNLKINISRQQLHVIEHESGRQIELSPLEFKLLMMFARNEERVLTREQFIEEVWGGGLHVLERTVDTHVSSLRRKLEGSSHVISAVYGTGYSLSAAKATRKKKAA